MPILFNEKEMLFKLDTLSSSYIIQVYDEGYLLHLYYGAKIPDMNVKGLAFKGLHTSHNPGNEIINNRLGNDQEFSMDLAPMEYPTFGAGDFRTSAIQIKNSAGNSVTDIRYKGHRIYDGKPQLEGLPATFAREDEAQTLEIFAEDAVTGAAVTLIYTVFEGYGAMARSVRVTNTSDKAMDLEKVYSCSVDFPGMDYQMVNLYGEWFEEREEVHRNLQHGTQGIYSKRGGSSHEHNPFLALIGLDATEEHGECYGFNFVYSGNFVMEVDVDCRCCSRFTGGINPETFNWHLEPGETFQAPEMVMVYSNEGMTGMSHTFHRLYMKHLIRSRWRDVRRPVLINSWEAAYFDFDDDKLVAFAEEAKDLGIDMLVMDDGWFGKRNNDDSSLGDWYVNTDKLKGGLSSLIERVNALGLKFGIWYEPEMVSPDSDLYRAHPDWCLHVEGREKSIARNQLVLDMSRQDVRDNLFEQIASVFRNNKIDYIKWDFNRSLTEAASMLLPAERQGEVFHRFVLGTYELMDRFTREFPDVLFENCASGGGRFDAGMLYYSPQIWTSDDTDAIERLSIQFGTSLVYPVSTMGAHVADRPRTPLATRGDVALMGTFGYELDPRKLSDEDKELVKKQIEEYHRYYDLIHFGDLYRLIKPVDNAYHCAWQYVNEEKTETLVTVVTMRQRRTPFFILRLRGLDPTKLYKDMDTGEIYSGALLMNAGINLTPLHTGATDHAPSTDGTSLKKYFKELGN
ncbi:MAG: alpha-galactosidase [Clostridia bacterium]|nr:alpha-galactosidase [Clostridia bacterium]